MNHFFNRPTLCKLGAHNYKTYTSQITKKEYIVFKRCIDCGDERMIRRTNNKNQIPIVFLGDE